MKVGTILGGLAVILFAAIPGPAEQPDQLKRVLLRDGFDGSYDLPWTVLNPDANAASLTKNPGCLTISTQRGSMYRNNDRPIRNLFLVRLCLATMERSFRYMPMANGGMEVHGILVSSLRM